MAPLRIVGQRGRADWLLVAATWLVILCATTLLVIGVMYGDAVALSGLRQRLAAEPPPATSVEVAMRVAPGELAAVDDVVTRQSRRILAWADGELIRTVRSGSFDFADGVAGLTDEDLAVVEAIDALSDHATLVSGGWPTPGRLPVEVTLPGPAADRLGLAPGDRITLSPRTGPPSALDILVVGVWEPDDPEDRYWVRDGLELTGVSDGPSFTLIGPFTVDPIDLEALEAGGKADVTWRVIPDFANLALSNVRWMRSDAAALDARIATELGPQMFYSVSTDLPAALGAADRSLLVSRSGVLVLAIQFAILAGYALILVAGLLAEQRRIETALLRSRGAGPRYLAGMALLEGLVLVVPAVLLAPFVALGALSLFDGLGPLAAAGVSIQPRIDGAALLVAGGTGLACLVGLLLSAMLSGGRLAAVRQALGRQGSRSVPARLGIDLALVALAGIGMWQLRQYGAPLTATVRGSVGLDPLLVAAPAIGLLAGAILALRVVPLLAELAERAVGRQAGLVGPLGARQLFIVILAAGGAYLLRQRGIAGSSTVAELESGDPLLAAVPALIGLAVGLVAVRLYPLPLRVAEWFSDGWRGSVPALGLHRAARSGDTGSWPLIVLLVTVAIGTFSSTVLSSVERGQVAAAWQEVGADFAVTPGTRPFPGDFDASSLPGIDRAARAHVDTAALGRGGPRVELHALDTAAYAEVTAGTEADADLPRSMRSAPVPDDPIPAILSRTAASSGARTLRVGDEVELIVNARLVTMRVSAIRDRFPGIDPAAPWVVVPLDALRAAASRDFSVEVVFLRAPAATATGIRSAMDDVLSATTVAGRSEVLGRLRSGPLLGAVAGGFLAAVVVAVVLAAIATTAALILLAATRRSETAHLRILGFSPRDLLALSIIEHGPAVLGATLGGVILGIGVAWFVAPGLDLAGLIGSPVEVELIVDWRMIGALLAALGILVSAAIAAAAGVGRRANLSSSARRGIE